MLLSLNLYDESGKLIAILDENEWRAEPGIPWDLEAKYQKITIRQSQRKIDLNIDSSGDDIKITGQFWHKGQHIDLQKEHLLMNGVIKNMMMKGCMFSNTSLKIDTVKGIVQIGR